MSGLLLEATGLLFDEGAVVEVVDLHGPTHFIHGLAGFFACHFAALAEYLIDGGNVLLVLCATLAYGFECLLQHFHEEFLALDITEAATGVVVFHLLKCGVVACDASHLFVGREGVEVGEDGVALEVSGVADLQVERVGVHGLDFLVDLVGRVAEVDAVAEAFAHLGLAVGAGQTQAGCVVGQQYVGLYEGLSVDIVEAANYLATLFEHGFLVVAGWNGCCLEHGDVGCLADGIGEEAYGNALAIEAAHLYLGLDGWVALQTGDADHIHEIEREFAEFGYLALDEQRGLRRVEACCKVVEGDLDDVLAHLLGVVNVVCKCLRVSLEDKYLIVKAGVLEFYATPEGTDIVTDMEFAGRAVAC